MSNSLRLCEWQGQSFDEANTDSVFDLGAFVGDLTVEEDANSDDISLEGLQQELEECKNDDVVANILSKGTKLREYTKGVENNLRQVELDSIQDYIEESDNLVSLHDQIRDCDHILSQMETLLSGFQAEIGSISSDIKILQEKSMDMGLKLKNRKVAESKLAKFVEDIIVPPRMIDIIVDGESFRLFSGIRNLDTHAFIAETIVLFVCALFNPVFRLNGKNYMKWSQLVRTFLKGKGKLSHLFGTGPKKGDPGFDAWDEDDSMVMFWLWNSMLPEISDSFMFLPMSKEIWEAAQQTYSKVRDAARVFEIKSKISDTKQGDRSVMGCIEMKCSDDAAMLKNFIEKDRTYNFLADLNMEFDQVRIQILGKKELPSLNETISIINAEESRRGVMLYAQPVEESAMLGKFIDKNLKFNAEKTSASHTANSEVGRMESRPLNKDKMWCTYCKKPRHTREQCRKLHGKSQSSHWNAGPKSEKLRSQVYMTQSKEDMSHGEVNFSGGEENEFNKEDIGRLRSLLDSLEKSKGGVSALIVYVDDIIVTGNDSDEKEALRKYLAKEFEIKNLGKLKYFLGIEVARSKEGIFVSQQKYVLDLLEETAQVEGFSLESAQIWKELEAYTNVDCAGSLIDRRSTSGYCTFLGGNLVTWRSKKQPVVARSSSEAEFRSMVQDFPLPRWIDIGRADGIKLKLEEWGEVTPFAFVLARFLNRLAKSRGYTNLFVVLSVTKRALEVGFAERKRKRRQGKIIEASGRFLAEGNVSFWFTLVARRAFSSYRKNVIPDRGSLLKSLLPKPDLQRAYFVFPPFPYPAAYYLNVPILQPKPVWACMDVYNVLLNGLAQQGQICNGLLLGLLEIQCGETCGRLEVDRFGSFSHGVDGISICAHHAVNSLPSDESNICVDEFMPSEIVVSDEYMRTLEILSKKLKFIEVDSMVKTSTALKDVQPELERLRQKAVTKVFEFIVQKLHALRKPKTNIQILQQSLPVLGGFVRILAWRYVISFLKEHGKETYTEIRAAYVDTMNKVLSAHFRAYIQALEKLQLDIATSSDLIGVETRSTSLFSRGREPLKNRSAVFALGERINILKVEIDEPALIPHIAEASSRKYPYEVLFRSLHKLLLDTATSEYLFCDDFFGEESIFYEIFSDLKSFLKEDDTRADLRRQMQRGPFAVIDEHFNSILPNCFDAIGIMLMIRIIHHHQVFGTSLVMVSLFV
ncbi:hypothetical protein RJ639_009131 [Escallonia herrerae]|uniref:Uncharacterized protein n=1 Tax=Escallonia herrerae TaxID=1293975 RepID=A0AA88VTZ4_9ASTE|nr:hypothetical protein RJ639_009131 [Escallonia herrerae]